MIDMYEIVEYLCKRNFISIAQMCRDIGIRPTIISELKHGRTKNLSYANMLKIANYFQISVDVFSEGVFEETLPNDCDRSSIIGYRSSQDALRLHKVVSDLSSQRNISIEKLSSELGIDRRIMANLKAGKRAMITTDILTKIANFFNVSVDYLLENEKGLPEKSSKPSDDDIKIALFGGGGEVTDEMWEEAIFAIQLIKERHKRKNNDK